MAYIKGRLIYVAFEDQIIECAMTASMNVTASKVVESTQCGGGFEESSPSTIEWNVQVEGKLDPAKTFSGNDIMAAILAGTVGTVYWGEATIGKTFYYGEGYFTNYVESANQASDEKVSFTATLQGTGILTSDVVTASTLG
jgi:hypothetical protein